MRGPIRNVFTSDRKNVLMLYDHNETHVKTIAHYLESFYRHSRFSYSYVASFSPCEFDLNYFDAVVIHFSVRVCHAGHLSSSFARALKGHRGLKALFLQDEYENTGKAHQAIRDLGINVVFTCVPGPSIPTVYPPSAFPGVRFVPVLTGYAPLDIDRLHGGKPMRERSILIGYRGRRIGYWYGDLGQEKLHIGQRMKAICDARRLKTDIAWEESDRIYGNWFEFLGNCRATLGTESGANIFDFDGELALAVQRAQYANPDVTYEEIRTQYLKDREGEVVMNQVSPKIFEAIAMRTALVLFEGHYSGVVQPGVHFLALKKDFSNVDEILAKLQDDALLETMTRRAYEDVIQSGRFSYAAFVRQVDEALFEQMKPRERATPAWLPLPPCDALPDFTARYNRTFRGPLLKRLWARLPSFVRARLNRERLKRWWVHSPSPLRGCLRPMLQAFRAVLK
ncbi:MAG: hypothetical protein HYX68_00370 [Planctomycetes bacterium]|nr:hypothetical protein [Planctomycetota bacterium]